MFFVELHTDQCNENQPCCVQQPADMDVLNIVESAALETMSPSVKPFAMYYC